MKEGKQYQNKDLCAFARLQDDGIVEYGFFDHNGECEDPFHSPKEHITRGIHYEKGGGEYRKLCEWVASLFA